MKKILKAMIIAFSMYSRIPMPNLDWDKEAEGYALCFFPLVGCVIGALMYAAGELLITTDCSAPLKGAVMTVLPIIISGKIHFDGFLDTSDALGSWADKDKRLEIMKDPHTGAFAVTSGLIYFALSVGIWGELTRGAVVCAVCAYVISRALSGLSIAYFPLAKKDGLAAEFSNAANKRAVTAASALWLISAAAVMAAESYIMAAAVISAAAGMFIYHYYVCVRRFGGITGDTAGYFLTLSELVIPAVCVITSKILY